MQVYQQTAEEDLLLLQWWEELHRTGELAKTLGEETRALARFYALLRPPRVLLYEVDAEGLWLAFLMSPLLSGAAVTLWVAARKRQAAHATLAAVELAYETGFGEAPVLIGVTRQEKLVAAHLRWGYEVVGEVPGLFDGANAWVLYLTEPHYRAAKQRRRRRRKEASDEQRSEGEHVGSAGPAHQARL